MGDPQGTTGQMAGRGRFHWNAGGWFGGQLGPTIWMLIASVVLVVGGRLTGAAVAAACFVVPNVVGLTLWRRRGRIRPYPAIQMLLAVSGMTNVACVLFLGATNDLGRLNFAGTPWNLVALVAVLFVGMMLLFHLMETSARRRDPTKDG